MSAVLADYGFRTIRLSEDWENADFLAYHNDGERFLKVQLKGRLVLDTKYRGKELYICFPCDGAWYLYPHDEALHWGVAQGQAGKVPWALDAEGKPYIGAYSWAYPPKAWLDWLAPYRIDA